MNLKIFKNKNLLTTLVIILLSFFLAIAYSIDQYSINPALAISGKVQYPDKLSIYFIQSSNSWSFMTQFVQMLLQITSSIKVISIILLFISSLLFFTGIYLTVKTITSSSILAIATGFFIMFFRKNFGDIDYPTQMFSEHTNGMMGLAIVTFIFGLINNKNYILLGFFTIFLICVHLTMGLWILLILILTGLFYNYYNRLLFPYKKIIYGMLIGLIPVLLSFAFFKINTVVISHEFNQPIYDNYIKYWDGHRNAYGQLSLLNINYILKSLALVVLGALSLRYLDFNKNPQVKLFLIFIIFSVSISFLIYLTYKKFSFFYPDLFVRIIPTRFFIIHSVIGYAVIISLFFLFIQKTIIKNKIKYVSCLSIFLALIFFYTVSHYKNINLLVSKFLVNIEIIDNNDDKIFWKKIKEIKTKGYFLTSETTCLNTHSRAFKPIILCPHLIDFIPYLPELAEPTQIVMEEIYGHKFNKSPPKLKNGAIDGLRDFVIKDVFEKKTVNEWIKISNKFNVKGLIIPSLWNISFNPSIKGKKYSYYKIK